MANWMDGARTWQTIGGLGERGVDSADRAWTGRQGAN